MKLEEKLEHLVDNVRDFEYTYIDQLHDTLKIAELEEYEDEILERAEFNACDRCGRLELSEELIWPEYLEYDNENDQALLRGIEKEKKGDYCYAALCDPCVAELEKEGK